MYQGRTSGYHIFCVGEHCDVTQMLTPQLSFKPNPVQQYLVCLMQ